MKFFISFRTITLEKATKSKFICFQEIALALISRYPLTRPKIDLPNQSFVQFACKQIIHSEKHLKREFMYRV